MPALFTSDVSADLIGLQSLCGPMSPVRRRRRRRSRQHLGAGHLSPNFAVRLVEACLLEVDESHGRACRSGGPGDGVADATSSTRDQDLASFETGRCCRSRFRLLPVSWFSAYLITTGSIRRSCHADVSARGTRPPVVRSERPDTGGAGRAAHDGLGRAGSVLSWAAGRLARPAVRPQITISDTSGWIW